MSLYDGLLDSSSSEKTAAQSDRDGSSEKPELGKVCESFTKNYNMKIAPHLACLMRVYRNCATCLKKFFDSCPQYCICVLRKEKIREN